MEQPTKKTANELIQIIDNEGLAYALTQYLGRGVICTDDPELGALWGLAFDAVSELETHILLTREVKVV